MPQISVRGLEMPESPIRKLAPLAASAKKRGIKVYHLNIGQPDLPTPQVALDAIRNIDRTILEYSPSQGYLSYREKLVSYYKKYNINVNADDIIITCGGSEAAKALELMSFTIVKSIGQMAAVLRGEVDAVILTGGIAYCSRVTDYITRYCRFIAPIEIFPGENELQALAHNALRVLQNQTVAKIYE